MTAEENIALAKQMIKDNAYAKNPENKIIEAEKKKQNEVEELAEILKDPILFNRIAVDELDKKVVGEIQNRQAILLYSFGSLVKNHATASFNLGIDSSSGAGKDYTMNAVVTYHPEVTKSSNPQYRGFVKRTRISPTVLNYWHCSEKEPEWTWDGKICYLPDITGAVMNHEVFKLMCSDGNTTTITINNKAVDIEVVGKPVMFITTANTTPNNENLRRWPTITLDESIDQTKAIMKRQAEYAAKGKTLEYDQKIREALSYLKRVDVKVPFAEEMVKLLPSDHIIMRTHFQRFLDLIKASAAFHQYQRQKDNEGYVLAEAPQDYELARIALNQSTSNSLMIPLGKKQQKLVEIIKKFFIHEWFSVADLEPKVEFFSQSKLYEALAKLSEYGFFERDKQEQDDGKRKPVMVYRLKDIEAHKLPTWGDIKKDG